MSPNVRWNVGVAAFFFPKISSRPRSCSPLTPFFFLCPPLVRASTGFSTSPKIHGPPLIRKGLGALAPPSFPFPPVGSQRNTTPPLGPPPVFPHSLWLGLVFLFPLFLFSFYNVGGWGGGGGWGGPQTVTNTSGGFFCCWGGGVGGWGGVVVGGGGFGGIFFCAKMWSCCPSFSQHLFVPFPGSPSTDDPFCPLWLAAVVFPCPSPGRTLQTRFLLFSFSRFFNLAILSIPFLPSSAGLMEGVQFFSVFT